MKVKIESSVCAYICVRVCVYIIYTCAATPDGCFRRKNSAAVLDERVAG